MTQFFTFVYIELMQLPLILITRKWKFLLRTRVCLFSFSLFLLSGWIPLRAQVAQTGTPLHLAFSTIEMGAQSGLEEAVKVQLFRIDTQEKWQKFWTEHHSNRYPVEQPPDIDFQNFEILSVVDRLRNSGGYTLRIVGLETSQRRIIVKVKQVSPGKGCFTSMALTRSFHIVKIPKTSLEIEMRLQEHFKDCH